MLLEAAGWHVCDASAANIHAARGVIEGLIQMAKEFREASRRGENLGLDESELAFYDALADNESAVRELPFPTFRCHRRCKNGFRPADRLPTGWKEWRRKGATPMVAGNL